MLKAGGRLVYSTCTLNDVENEGVIQSILKDFPCMHTVSFSLPNGETTLHAPDGMLRLYPHVVQGEGHFMAYLQKEASVDTNETSLMPAHTVLGKPEEAILKAYEAFQSAFCETVPKPSAQLGDTLLCAPALPPLRGIKVLRAGIELGVQKGRVFAPNHAMALAMDPDGPIRVVDEKEARAYHRGETLPMPEDARGYFLVMFEGFALGFGKASGGQLKNHYPKGLRRG